MKRLSLINLGFLLGAAVLLCVSCADRYAFTQLGTTEYFVENYNPQFLDVLWMVDNRSPMFRVQGHIADEASKFFTRLDAEANINYKMGFVSSDMSVHPGQLQPIGDPLILTKNLGTLPERTQAVADILSQVVNLQTGATDEGFASTWTALNTEFTPRPNVPLVLVFISDSDDHSPVPSGQDAVQYYAGLFLGLKNNNASLVRAYAINYLPLNGQPMSDANRCATFNNADIDQPGFQNRYFNLANQLNGSTAGLCGSFSDQIDLTGLQLQQLPTTFPLSNTPVASSIEVTVFTPGSQNAISTTWSYDATNNQIVFQQAPPAGTTIAVTYTQGN